MFIYPNQRITHINSYSRHVLTSWYLILANALSTSRVLTSFPSTSPWSLALPDRAEEGGARLNPRNERLMLETCKLALRGRMLPSLGRERHFLNSSEVAGSGVASFPGYCEARSDEVRSDDLLIGSSSAMKSDEKSSLVYFLEVLFIVGTPRGVYWCVYFADVWLMEYIIRS